MTVAPPSYVRFAMLNQSNRDIFEILEHPFQAVSLLLLLVIF